MLERGYPKNTWFSNDIFGHSLGDQVLIHFANIINSSLRPKDSLIRYGGEEFLVMVRQDDVLNIQEYAAKLCRMIQVNPYVLDGGEKINISCSIGAATFRPAVETIHECIERADTAMVQS